MARYIKKIGSEGIYSRLRILIKAFVILCAFAFPVLRSLPVGVANSFLSVPNVVFGTKLCIRKGQSVVKIPMNILSICDAGGHLDPQGIPAK
jgi:hypothetical protein